MENHPIPQDVTGFKFKLIGSITVKQFLYLFAGGILAFVFLITPVFMVIKIPLMLTFGVIGIAFAFVPVDGRPLDKMLFNYIKAIPAENQYVYRKTGVNLPIFEDLKPQKQTKSKPEKNTDEERLKKNILFNQLSNSRIAPDKYEADFLNKVKSFFDESISKTEKVETPPTPPKIHASIPNPIKPQAQKPTDEVSVLKEQLEEVKEKQQEDNTRENQENLAELQKRLEEAIKEKEALEKRLFEIAKQKSQEPIYKPSVATDVKETPHVKSVTPSSSINIGFPTLPDVPNIVLGIVKDPRGKVLQNIIVEIIDKNENPVRAFKTNKLGQFASATPLPNGVYKIFFEDPQKQNKFDAVEITLNGEIFSPLEIISVDQREELRRQLFGA